MTYQVTSEKILKRMASHLARVGLYRGASLSSDIGGDHNPCTMLKAFHVARATCRPTSMAHDHTWDLYHAAHDEALRRISDHLNQQPIKKAPDGWSMTAYRDIIVLSWGQEEGRTTTDAVNAVRVAAGLGEVAAEGQQDALFDSAVVEPERSVAIAVAPGLRSRPSGKRRPVTNVHLPRMT